MKKINLWIVWTRFNDDPAYVWELAETCPYRREARGLSEFFRDDGYGTKITKEEIHVPKP